MVRKDIASLLDALCERPLAGEGDALSPELEALCRRSAEAASLEAGAPDPARPVDDMSDPDRLRGLLAVLRAGDGAAAGRDAFVQAAADSAALRLECESALAFLDRLDEPLEPAPPHLLAALEPARSETAPGRRFAPAFAMRQTSWRLAGACALLLAGGLSWSIYGPGGSSTDAAPPQPEAAAMPASLKAASPIGVNRLAEQAEACPPGAPAPEMRTVAAQAVGAAAPPEDTSARARVALPGAACGGDDHLLADKSEALARRVETLRRVKAARAAETARRDAAETGRNAAAAARAARSGTPAAIGASPPVLDSAKPAAAARSAPAAAR